MDSIAKRKSCSIRVCRISWLPFISEVTCPHVFQNYRMCQSIVLYQKYRRSEGENRSRKTYPEYMNFVMIDIFVVFIQYPARRSKNLVVLT